MNRYQDNLYNNLTALVESNEAFYFQDFTLDGKTYRIFNYRLASYTDFCLPGALECRGVMFEVCPVMTGHSNMVPVRLASLPMEKFFNLNENPMTMNLDLDQVEEIYEKADGSLMSTYMHNGELRLKSKGSLFSDQAVAAMKHLDKDPSLKSILATFANIQCTVNLEWCSPEHRIVLGYLKPTLKILNVRDNRNGDYVNVDGAYWTDDYMVGSVDLDRTFVSPKEFLEDVPKMQNIEGFVFVMEDGQRVKIKTEWYLSLHHAKESVNNPRRLFECILDEGIDDIRSMFYDDALAMQIIDEMQVKVDHLYNNMVKTTEEFYDDNKHLSKKEYVLLAKDQLDPFHHALVFGKYDRPDEPKPFKAGPGRVDYKGYLKYHWRDLGLRDTSSEKDE